MNEACSFDENSDGVSDCLQDCLNLGCSLELLSNDQCDSACDFHVCGFDRGYCGLCASACTAELLTNAVCDSECNVFECYYDSSACAECSAGCTNAKLLNEECEVECNFSICNYDAASCSAISECVEGCFSNQLGDSVCDPECNTELCNFDDYDCLCSPKCLDSDIGDHHCDDACNNWDCKYDQGDCSESCPESCTAGDGICDDLCWSEVCEWRDADCGCAPDCAYDEFESCKSQCLVLDCDYAETGGSPCTEAVTIQLAKYLQLITKDFTATVSLEDCAAASLAAFGSTCKSEELASGVCMEHCYLEECAYSFGSCGSACTEDCGCAECCYTENPSSEQKRTHCLSCDSGLQFFTSCVSECPTNYQESTSYAGLCVPSDDDNSSENSPAVYYVTGTTGTPGNYGQGTESDPFNSLAVALASTTNEFVHFKLIGTHPIVLEELPSDSVFASLLNDPKNPLEASQSSKIVIESVNQASELVITSEKFLVFQSRASLEFRSLTFSVSALSADCTSEDWSPCDYCCLVNCADSYTSLCVPFHDYTFLSVSGAASLTLSDVTFRNMRSEFKSLISVQNGDLEMTNVTFSQVAISRVSDHAIVEMNCTQSALTDCGSLTFINGAVTLLNDGYEVQPPASDLLHQPFLIVHKANDLTLTSIAFTYNIVSGQYLIRVEDIDELKVDSCVFEDNLFYNGLLSIEYPEQVFSLDPNSLVQELLYDHLIITNCSFINNFLGEGALVQGLYLDYFIQNAVISECNVTRNLLQSQAIFDFQGSVVQDYMQESTWKLLLEGETQHAAFYTKQTILFSAVRMWDNTLNGQGLLHLETLGNLELESVRAEHNTEGWLDLSVIIQKFILNPSSSVSAHLEAEIATTLFSTLATFSSIHTVNWKSVVLSEFASASSSHVKMLDCNSVVIENLQVNALTVTGAEASLLIFNRVQTLSVLNSTFDGCANEDTKSNGLIFIDGNGDFSAEFKGCQFRHNHSQQTPGIRCLIPRLLVEETEFWNNTVETGRYGIVSHTEIYPSYLHSSVLKQCNFTGNKGGTGGSLAYSLDTESTIHINITLHLIQCTFEDNYGPGTAYLINIGHFLNLETSSVISECLFARNQVEGVIFEIICYEGELAVEGSEFYSNSCTGGMIIHQGWETCLLSISNCTFAENASSAIIGVDTYSSRKTIRTWDLMIRDNIGAALALASADLYDTNSLIQYNSVVSSDYLSNVLPFESAGVFISLKASFMGNGTRFIGNRSVKGGAASLITNTIFVCIDCVFYQNSAQQSGGAIYSANGDVFLVGCEIIENSSDLIASVLELYGAGELKYSEIKESVIRQNYDTLGKAFVISRSYLFIRDCQISENWSQYGDPSIYVSLADLVMESTEIWGQSGSSTPLLSASSSSITMGNCSIHDFNVDVSSRLIAIVNSNLLLSKSALANINGPGLTVLYALSDSVLNITSTTFEYLYTGNFRVIHVSESELSMDNVTVRQYEGTGLYLSQVTDATVTLSNCTFAYGSTNKFTAGIMSASTKSLMLDNVRLQHLKSVYGGAIYATADEESSVLVSNSCFWNNSAASGGAIHATNTALSITSSTFQLNSALDSENTMNDLNSDLAGRGGALFFSCSNVELCSLTLDSINFTENSATWRGGAIDWSDELPSLSKIMYSNNSAFYGDDLASFPVTIQGLGSEGNLIPLLRRLSESSVLTVTSVSPGQLIESAFTLALVDHYSQVVKTNTDSQATILSQSSNNTVSGTTTVDSVNGTFTFDDLAVFATPGSVIQLTVKSAALENNTETITLSVELRECEPGEIQQEFACVYCEVGYSFDPGEALCRDCPAHAKCFGGTSLVPREGYWRSRNTSHTIWKCPNKDACLESPEKNPASLGKCADGYIGNKCQSCDRGYSRSLPNTCMQCPNRLGNIFKLVGLVVLSIVAIIVIVRSSLNSAHEPRSLSSVHFKIFVNYLQLATLIVTFELEWPEYVQALFDVQLSAGSASEQLLSLDCFLQEDESADPAWIYFSKVLGMSVLPFVLILLSTLVWLLVSTCRRDYSPLKGELIATYIILIFLIYPSVLQTMFQSLSCTEIEEGEYWLIADLNIPCWDRTHLLYTLGVALPSIIVWGFAMPAICFGLLYRNRKRLHVLSIRKKYGFLFNGYTKREYYWELVILFRKLTLMFCTLVLSVFSKGAQALFALLIVSGFLALHLRFRPYNNDSLNEMEFRSVLISAVTIYCGIFYLVGDLGEVMKIALFILIVLANLYFLSYWTYKLSEVGLRLLATRFHWVRKCCFPKDVLDDEEAELQEVVPHVIGRGGDKMYTLCNQSLPRSLARSPDFNLSTIQFFRKIMTNNREDSDRRRYTDEP